MNIRLLLTILLLGFGVTVPVAAEQMSVDQAYKQGHYKRTPFDGARSKIKSEDDIRFLQKLFKVSDNVMLARVLVMNGIYTGRGANAVTYSIDMTQLSDYFVEPAAPEHLKKVQVLMLEVMQEQKDFMMRWASSTLEHQRKIEKTYESQPEVQSSTRKVQQIYTELMRLYPEESEYNKRAFFDHLIALDLGS